MHGYDSRSAIASHIVQAVVTANQEIAKPDKVVALLNLVKPLLADQV